jgi:hypothetical protein
MDSELVRQFIPMVAIVMTFGLPAGIVFITKYFAFKHRELEAELEARKMLSERDRVELEKRIERLESVVMGARVQQHGIPSLLPPQSSSALYEPPPSVPNEPVMSAVKPREQL